MCDSPAIEKWWPVVGAGIVVIGWYATGRPFPASPDSLFGTAATVASVFASFLGVSKAIILSIKTTKTYEVLKDLGYTTTLFAHLKAGIIASIGFAGLSIVGFFVSHERILMGHKLFDIFEVLWIFFAALSLFTYVRITNILFKLLKAA